MELEKIRVENPKGALGLGAAVILKSLQMPKYEYELTKERIKMIHNYYEESTIFLTRCKILPMVCDSMGYDLKKFRAACVSTLEKNYLEFKNYLSSRTI